MAALRRREFTASVPSWEHDDTSRELAVTGEATEQMDGPLEVATEKGERSCFVVRLPRVARVEAREVESGAKKDYRPGEDTKQ